MSIDGQVTLSTGKYRHYFSAGEWGLSRSDGVLPAQLARICEEFYGTALKSVDTESKHDPVRGGRYPSIVVASCFERDEFKLLETRERLLAEETAQQERLKADERARQAMLEQAVVLQNRKDSRTSYGFTPTRTNTRPA